MVDLHELDAAARAFLRERAPGELVSVMGAGQHDLDDGLEYLARLGAAGWVTPTWPVGCGGLGATAEEADAIAAVLRRFAVPDLYPFSVGLAMVGPTVLRHGTGEQVRRWLPKIASGEEIWCQMFSEPEAGSDLANLACRAERDGDEWVLTGQKLWSSRAAYARRGLLLARSDPDLPKHAGITAFGIDLHTPGVTVRLLRQMNDDAHFSEVFIDEVRVPDSDRIGDVGQGWAVALTVLGFERAALGDRSTGGTRLVEELLPMAGADPLARQRVIALWERATVGTWAGQRAKATRRADGPPGPEGSLGKLRGVRSYQEVAYLAAELRGADAMLAEGEWTTRLLTAPAMSLRGGTNEIQKNIAAERGLGLPPEPRADKDRPWRETRGR